MNGPKHTRTAQSPSPTLSRSTRERVGGTANPASPLSFYPSALNAHSLTPHAVLHLQRTIGNQAVNRVIQRAFDAETVTNDIAIGGESIDRLGGQTEGAYLITTTSEEHPKLVLKPTNDPGPVFSASLAKALGIKTPEIISVPTAGILKKITKLDSGLGKLLSEKEYVTVQKYIEGAKTLDRQRKFTDGTLGEIGAIASFDMLTGKQDLFDNVCFSRYDNEENFKNILFQDNHPVDIDLGTGGGNFENQKRIIQEILENPTEVSNFVTGKVGRLMEHAETGVSLEGSKGLLVQRGMLVTVVKTAKKAEKINQILENKPKGKEYAKIEDMVKFYQEIAEQCEGAINKIDVAYEESIEQERVRAEKRKLKLEQEKEERRQKQELERQERERQEEQAVQDKGCKACFLTTACVEYKGLADDCEELTVLRAFRDGYMRALPDGEAMIREYYTIAPSIVRCIWEDEEHALILEGMYQIVLGCVASIKAGNPQAALEAYVQKVLELKEKYLEPLAA